MKFLLYSDLHLREERLDDAATVLSKIGEIAIQKKVDRIINAGDTFSTRGVIRTKCLKMLYDFYKEWSLMGLLQTIIVGNHDQEDKAGAIHPMKIFEEFDGWRVVDKPEVIDGSVFVPYLSNKEFKKFIDKTSFSRRATAFVHLGIRGALQNDSHRDTDGIPLEWFKVFKRVFSGHYHYRSILGNVQYIGSPLQQNFAEMSQEKGVLIYETGRRNPEFIPIPGTPKHYEIGIHWEKGKQKWERPKGIQSRDFVRVILRGEAEEVSRVQQSDLLKKVKCASLMIHREIKEKTVSRMNLETKDIYDRDNLMGKYVDFVDTDLDRKRILKVGREIMNASL